MNILIAALILVPFIMAAISLFIRKPRFLGVLNSAGYLVVFIASILLVMLFLWGSGSPVSAWGCVYIDYLSVFFLFTISVVAFAASIYSIGYISAETEESKMSPRRAGAYYHLFNLFSLAMFIVPILNNIALMWIAIEMTTLLSAFLVGFHNTKESVEAAWKYIIICSVGIVFALLGIIFFYYTSSRDAGVNSMEWAAIFAKSGMLNANIVRLALIFIMVGYGTKAGLAPMHNWLPDAHSQALSPVSGLLSGVLIKISFYAILRFVMLANNSAGYDYSARLFTAFGIISIGIAGAFIVVQKDLKRLLAYSSIENIGLVSLGFGFGMFGGVFAGLLHAFNHAVTKSLMFFSSGNVVKAYGGNNMNGMQGVLRSMPFTGISMFLGLFAIAGMPPFSMFISKFSIFVSAFRGRFYIAALAMFLFIALAFAGLLYHMSKVILGRPPRDMGRVKEALSSKLSFIFLMAFIIGFGLYIPRGFLDLLAGCQRLVLGIH
ncbi:MAG: hydrogenase 4 subunit F [Candidatus Omnitrophica bacterium]|nr:hydrogenase 4 subunit F [Candidatus Omnitrophota bacterium]